MQNRTLYFGDNLDILREKIQDESFDLVYLDPPFNSNRDYNALFREGLVDSQAQVQAFEDSWHWTEDAERTFEELIGSRKSRTPTNQKIADLMLALEKLVGRNDILAYLTMMTIRLVELHRVLKKTGSIYLHCDPTVSHYLKAALDAIFGPKNFRSEIIWKRTSAHSSAKRYGPVHDVILFYSKSDSFLWNPQFTAHDPDYTAKFYRHTDVDGRRLTLSDLTAAGIRHGFSGEPWRGIDVTAKGNHWKFTIEHLEELDRKGRIYWPPHGGMPRYKRYLDEVKGIALQDVWTDIFPIGAQASERLGYPTQKPEALLERIIRASSNESDWVLDPFCGCGTTVAVAERLNRSWVGIDITALAINLIKRRLHDHHPGIGVIVDGLPRDLAGARALFAKDPFEFEYWVLDLLSATPAQSKSREQMRGADKGVDGVMTILMDIQNDRKIHGRLLVQVKGGKIERKDIAALKGDFKLGTATKQVSKRRKSSKP